MSTINVDSKGYGKIYKAVMRNRKLPLLAKSIYAYFCTYAGNGHQAFPKRDKIVRDLRINKDTFTKHLNNLVSDGYIAKERTANGNLYTIVQTVYGYEKQPQPENDMSDMLIMGDIGAQGFGTVPKLVMLDARLTAQAKAIYAYFASFAGAGSTAFPRRSTIMRDLSLAPATYYSHFNLLLEYGYLSVERRKNNGKFDISIYRLAETVDASDLPEKENYRASSEKAAHGSKHDKSATFSEKGEISLPISEKLAHGEMLKTATPMSEKLISEELLSEKMSHEKFGHANINNNSTSNNYFIKELSNNHQQCPQPVMEERRTLFSSADVRRCIRFDHLRSKADAWGQLLKSVLGILNTPEEKARYHQTMDAILLEIVNQLVNLLNKADRPTAVLTRIESEAFTVMFDEMLSRWDKIRNIQAYIEASLKNLIKGTF